MQQLLPFTPRILYSHFRPQTVIHSQAKTATQRPPQIDKVIPRGDTLVAFFLYILFLRVREKITLCFQLGLIS
jgi:hypothetical protein